MKVGVQVPKSLDVKNDKAENKLLTLWLMTFSISHQLSQKIILLSLIGSFMFLKSTQDQGLGYWFYLFCAIILPSHLWLIALHRYCILRPAVSRIDPVFSCLKNQGERQTCLNVIEQWTPVLSSCTGKRVCTVDHLLKISRPTLKLTTIIKMFCGDYVSIIASSVKLSSLFRFKT